jgi:hypothetical protein
VFGTAGAVMDINAQATGVRADAVHEKSCVRSEN